VVADSRQARSRQELKGGVDLGAPNEAEVWACSERGRAVPGEQQRIGVAHRLGGRGLLSELVGVIVVRGGYP